MPYSTKLWDTILEQTAVSAAATAGQIEILKFSLDQLSPEFDIKTDFNATIVHRAVGHAYLHAQASSLF
jgi:hypothetical protein